MHDFEMDLIGIDGSRWRLHGPGSENSPVRAMEGELPEFYDTPRENYYRSRVGVGGASYRGGRDPAAYISINIDIYGDDWEWSMSRFRQALAFDEDAELVVRTKTAGERRLKVRLSEAIRMTNAISPHAVSAAMYEVPLIALDPYWTGATQIQSAWSASNKQIAHFVTVTNPGDTHVWPEWVLTSPGQWILPDKDFTDPEKPVHMVQIPFLPYGRDTVVRTAPHDLTADSVDDTLSVLAGLRGQSFIHPIPPRTEATQVPVAIDPMPGLQIAIPDAWKAWIAQRMQEVADRIGVSQWTAMTPDDVGREVRKILTDAHPEWLPDLTDGLLAKMTAQVIADAWAAQYGKWSIVNGSTVQVRITPKWRSPW